MKLKIFNDLRVKKNVFWKKIYDKDLNAYAGMVYSEYKSKVWDNQLVNEYDKSIILLYKRLISITLIFEGSLADLEIEIKTLKKLIKNLQQNSTEQDDENNLFIAINLHELLLLAKKFLPPDEVEEILFIIEVFLSNWRVDRNDRLFYFELKSLWHLEKGENITVDDSFLSIIDEINPIIKNLVDKNFDESVKLIRCELFDRLKDLKTKFIKSSDSQLFFDRIRPVDEVVDLFSYSSYTYFLNPKERSDIISEHSVIFPEKVV